MCGFFQHPMFSFPIITTCETDHSVVLQTGSSRYGNGLNSGIREVSAHVAGYLTQTFIHTYTHPNTIII